MNPNPVERIYLDNKKLLPQTINHHVKRYQFAHKLLRRKQIILDLACGSGYGTDMLKVSYNEVLGMDKDSDSIKYARHHYGKCRFEIGDIIDLDLSPDSYDGIVLFEAIEHITFDEGIRLLAEISNALTGNGIFILSTPRDINDKHNRLHKSEWPYFLLKNELGSLFSDVRLYGQDWDSGVIDERDVRDNDFYIAVCKK